ncbi:MAG: hypothetical protein JO257_22700 [Deltaproteobacteria bacterium]|nr:hypothetical protein [Deltaproteobacteria bacterium]
MRMIGAALLALAACNTVFGIKDTQREPDAADPMFTGHMNWVAPSGSGTETFPIGGEAVDTTPLMLQIGSGAGSGSDALASAPYDAMTGTFRLGFKLAGQQWRLVYTLPGDTVSHEYQWNIQTPDLVVPRMTRKGATPVPANSGYDITASTTFSVPGVTVSGANSFAYPPNFTGGNIMYAYPADAQALLGPLSAPASSDFVLVTDAASQNATRTGVIGFGVVQSAPALMAGSLTPLSPTWMNATQINIRPTSNQGTQLTRLTNALRTLGQNDANNPLPNYPHMTYGLAPTLAIYGFRSPPADCGVVLDSGHKKVEGLDCLASPAIVPLVEDEAFEQIIQVPDMASVPMSPVMYERYTIPREAHGVAMVSTIQSMVVAPSPATANESIDALSNTIVTAVLVDGMHLDTADISGATGPASMDVTVPAGSQPRLLTFNPRLGQDGALMARADDYVITLWQIQNPDSAAAKLHAVRVYHVLDASHGVYIEGQLLTPAIYVFSISARVGFPNIAQGDFRTVQYPLGESTVFTRQFRVQ